MTIVDVLRFTKINTTLQVYPKRISQKKGMDLSRLAEEHG